MAHSDRSRRLLDRALKLNPLEAASLAGSIMDSIKCTDETIEACWKELSPENQGDFYLWVDDRTD